MQNDIHLKKIKLKTAIISMAAFSLLSVMIPETAHAARCRNGTPTNILFESFDHPVYQLRIRPNAELSLGGCFKSIFDSDTAYQILGLKLVDRSISIDDVPTFAALQFPQLGFNLFDGIFPFYQYRISPRGLDPINFYVPSRFKFTAPNQKSFEVNLINNSDALFSSINGLKTILSTANGAQVSLIAFPNDFISPSLGFPEGVSESNLSSGLIVLGLLGSLIIVKRKI